jgi:hypothetical protein
MCIGRLATLGALSLLVLGDFSASSAQAGFITIYDTNKDPWKADTVLSGGILKDTTPNQDEKNPIRTTSVTLTFPYTFDSAFFNTIVFTQLKPSSRSAGGRAGNPDKPDDDTGAGAAFGLNFNLTATITNMQPVSWSGFKAKLIDLEPAIPRTGTADHPPESHFHFLGKMNDPYLSNPLKYVAGINGGLSFELGNGEVPPGKDLTFQAKIHDIVYKDVERGFELVLTPTPVPEPSSLVLIATGGAFLAACGRRVWKRWPMQ